MRVEQSQFSLDQGWEPKQPGGLRESDLVLVFGSPRLLQDTPNLDLVRRAYPAAIVVGCSTAGEIHGTQVVDDSFCSTAVSFDSTAVRVDSVEIHDVDESFSAGQRLAKALVRDDLLHIFVLSDGLNVNGSDLVHGITSGISPKVTVTGGLAGDGARFTETLVVCGGSAAPKRIAAVGFYGSNLRIGCGSLGGWDSFGPERLITRSKANVLYELDGRSALELYKSYLGDHALGLPATGLLFPLSLREAADETPVVRTILSIDEAEQSLIFAGDVPEGSLARLMKANFDRLIDGAIGAATTCHESLGSLPPDFAILISCVGRKMVLKQRIEEEVEGVSDVLGPTAILTGFYSYGEISPFTPGAKCDLHNQTMTITTFAER